MSLPAGKGRKDRHAQTLQWVWMQVQLEDNLVEHVYQSLKTHTPLTSNATSSNPSKVNNQGCGQGDYHFTIISNGKIYKIILIPTRELVK